jgi:chemotaxis protein MotB
MGVKKKEASKEPGCPLWMMTFGDCMSLLVTFFVMLIAFSNREEHKLMELIGALKGGLGMIPIVQESPGARRSSENLKMTAGEAQERVLVTQEEISKISSHEQIIEKRFARSVVGGTDAQMMLYLLRDGLSLIIHTATLFEEGTAKLNQESENLWLTFADLAASLEYEIRIVGVVPQDIVIKDSAVQTPWGLAAKRAMVVQDLLCEKCNYERSRFSVGVRVEGPVGQQQDKRLDLPADRIQIVLVGAYPTVEMTAEEVIIRNL